MCATKVPLISFVVPVHNAERTLYDCVCSITRQSFDDIEIILVNNCSTDGSFRKCNELAKEDGRIKVVDIAEKGVSAARNRGIELAIGEFVTFVDADDWIDSNVCEKFSSLNAEYDYDLFCFSAQYHNGKNSVASYLFGNDVDLFTQKQKEELQIKVFAPQAPIFSYKMNTRFAGSVCGKFYKREILLKNNLRFATETIISEDVLFNTLTLDFFHRIGYARDCFYHYEQSDASAQNRYRPNSDKYFLFVIKKIREWLRNTGKDQRFVDAANCLFVHYLFGVLKEDLCHRDNPHEIAYRKRLLECVLSKNEFSVPLKKSRMDYFSFPEQILVKLLRYRKIGTIFFFLKFIK